MTDVTPLRMVYVFEDGDRSDLALGMIDQLGQITAKDIASGQEESVDRIVAELNAQEQVYRREVAGFDRPMPTKTAVMRGMADFLAVQRETALRLYGIELVYDPSVFDNDPAGLDWPQPANPQEPLPPPSYNARHTESPENDG